MVQRRHRDPHRRGKLYLDSVLDVGSRRIVGFALGEHHDADLAEAALQMAVAVRGGRAAVTGVIMHTDQGSEFTARTFQAEYNHDRRHSALGMISPIAYEQSFQHAVTTRKEPAA